MAVSKPLDKKFEPALPPELMAAPMEFDKWSQERLLVEQRESTPTEPLFHYTGEAAFKGILANERLWCFSHEHQTDAEEFSFSLDVARRIIREVGKSKDAVTHHFCACLDDLLETNGLASPFEFYLFSLSRHRDHEPQWRQYGDGGRGFAIGFSPSHFQPTETELHDEANENIHVGRVIYGDELTAARHRLVIDRAAEITSRIANEHRSAVWQVKPIVYLETMAREVIASQLIWNCLTAKDAKYADEREVRCMLMNIRKKFDCHRRMHNGRPYVEASLRLKAAGQITEVLVGPIAPACSEAMVSEFVRANGYPGCVPVIRSKASL
jgi:hypothetical protein